MSEAAVNEDTARLVRRAEDLAARGSVREAIDLLSGANRHARDSQLERALVRVRRAGCSHLDPPEPPIGRQPVTASAPGDGVLEVGPADLDVTSLRTGLARSGCVLVRGLVPPERVAVLVEGIDAALAAHDAAERGEAVDRGWYNPFSMPDRVTQEASVSVVTPPDAFRPSPMP